MRPDGRRISRDAPGTSTGGPTHACMMVAVRVAIWRRGRRSRPSYKAAQRKFWVWAPKKANFMKKNQRKTGHRSQGYLTAATNVFIYCVT